MLRFSDFLSFARILKQDIGSFVSKDGSGSIEDVGYAFRFRWLDSDDGMTRM